MNTERFYEWTIAENITLDFEELYEDNPIDDEDIDDLGFIIDNVNDYLCYLDDAGALACFPEHSLIRVMAMDYQEWLKENKKSK